MPHNNFRPKTVLICGCVRFHYSYPELVTNGNKSPNPHFKAHRCIMHQTTYIIEELARDIPHMCQCTCTVDAVIMNRQGGTRSSDMPLGRWWPRADLNLLKFTPLEDRYKTVGVFNWRSIFPPWQAAKILVHPSTKIRQSMCQWKPVSRQRHRRSARLRWRRRWRLILGLHGLVRAHFRYCWHTFDVGQLIRSSCF